MNKKRIALLTAILMFMTILAVPVNIVSYAEDSSTESTEIQIDEKVQGINVNETEAGEDEPASLIDISSAKITTDKDNYAYTGQEIKPNVTVVYNGNTLTEDVDYVLSYANNVYPGTMSIVATGTGEYTGNVTKSVDIARVTGLKISSVKTTSVVLTWDKINGVSGYKVYAKTASGKWELSKKNISSDKTTCTVDGLVAGTGYSFKVCAFVNSYEGNASDVQSTPTKPLQGKITKVTAYPNLSIVTKWEKKSSSGYQIEIAQSSSFSNAKRYTVSGTSKSITKLTKGKKYYVRVRAYKKYSGKTVYGAWSAKKSITTKSTGWMTKNGYKYYYKNAKAVTGSCKINGNSYYFNKSGKCLGQSLTMWNKIKNTSSGTEYLIAVSRTANRVCVYTGSKGNWKMKYYWKCATGRDGKQTPKGYHTVPKTEPKLGYIGGHKSYTCWYATRFYKRCFFHSVIYNPGSKTSIQDGRLGSSISHGCIRLKLENAEWIYRNIHSGTRVVVY